MVLVEKLTPDIKLPSKAPSTLRIRPVAEAQVNTNSYRIKFTGVTVHRYEAKFFAKSERFGAKNIAEGLKNDVATEQRRILLSALFKQLLTSKPEIFGKEYMQYLFDGGQTIFSKDRLVLTADAVQKIPLDKEALNEKPRGYLPRRLSDLYVELKYVEEVRVDSMRLAQDELSDDRSALSFIEMIFNQKIVSSDQFHVFRQVCYEKEKTDGRPVEIEARIIKDGLSKGVRLGGSDPNEPQAMLQSSVKAGAFYPEISLKAYLLKLWQCRDERGLERAMNNDRRSQIINTDLKKLILQTTHLASNRTFICDDVDDKPIRDVIFAQKVIDADGNEIDRPISVVRYMEEKYHLSISCDECPGIIQKTNRGGIETRNFYPIDVLTILGDQQCICGNRCSYRGIIGTARPTVYTVVADEHPQKKRMESKELQNLTFALCHLHCAVLGTVSVPAFLYHAGAVAKRGRNNLCFDVHGGVDDASTNTSGSRQEQRNTKPKEIDAVELSKKLTPKLKIKFWS